MMSKSLNAVLRVTLLFILISCKEKTPHQAGICLSFDDRSIKEWAQMNDLLQKYDARVTFYVTQFDSLSTQEILLLKELEDKGHEIGSHGALHVISENYITKNSYNQYLKNEIDQNTLAMSKAGFNPESFAYPYGAKYWFTDFLLLKRFKTTRSVASLNSKKSITETEEIYYDFDGNRSLSAIGIDLNSGLTRSMIQEALQKAQDENKVLLLYGHSPHDEGEGDSYSFNLSFLEFILKEAKIRNLRYYRASDLIK